MFLKLNKNYFFDGFMEKEEWKIDIFGRVQGVCFRASVVHFVEAQIPDVVGIIANKRDGSVTIVARGSVEDLQKLLLFSKRGPPSAVVEKVIVTKAKNIGEFFSDNLKKFLIDHI